MYQQGSDDACFLWMSVPNIILHRINILPTFAPEYYARP